MIKGKVESISLSMNGEEVRDLCKALHNKEIINVMGKRYVLVNASVTSTTQDKSNVTVYLRHIK